MKKNLRSAFTLIELLVVIAIIAILAAILFPVFAQAKMAAKKITAVNNVRQIMLSQTIYMQDSDDMIMPKLRLGYGPAQNGGDPEQAMSWDKLVQPYMKNYGIMMSSEDARSKYKSPYGDVRRSYGVASNVYRAVQISQQWGWGSGPWKGAISSTSIPLPSETIAIGEKRQSLTSEADPWNGKDWYLGAQINNTRRDDLAKTDPRAPYGEIANKYNNGSIWGYVDTHARWIQLNGRDGNGNLHGTLLKGYEQKAAQWVGGNGDPFWDRGISCLDSGWIATDGDCKLPGE